MVGWADRPYENLENRIMAILVLALGANSVRAQPPTKIALTNVGTLTCTTSVAPSRTDADAELFPLAER